MLTCPRRIKTILFIDYKLIQGVSYGRGSNNYINKVVWEYDILMLTRKNILYKCNRNSNVDGRNP